MTWGGTHILHTVVLLKIACHYEKQQYHIIKFVYSKIIPQACIGYEMIDR